MDNSNIYFNKLIRPQWGWKTYTVILVSILILLLTAVDLELNFFEVITNFGKYATDLLGRMFPPDTRDLKEM